jgi:hypothetical protein
VHRAEILGHAKFLQVVEQRIRAGFSVAVPIAYPGYDYWKITARDGCGVVDVQSGASDSTGSWTPFYWWRDPIDTSYFNVNGLPETHEQYLRWHRHSQEIRYWRLYDNLGLFALWSIIPDVQAAAKGKPGLAVGKAILEKSYDLGKLTNLSSGSKLRVEAFNQWSTEAKKAAFVDRPTDLHAD